MLKLGAETSLLSWTTEVHFILC